MDLAEFEDRARERLAYLYGDADADPLLERLRSLLWRHQTAHAERAKAGEKWSERDVLLITYGDSVERPGARPLAVLKDFVDRRLSGVFSYIHILPFFPYSSDDGFAVSDYRAVNPGLGTWDDIAAVGERFNLMFDLVLNHVSRGHLWFVNYVRDEHPGKDFFVEVDPAENLTLVVRPRSTPLLSQVHKPRGMRHVWATFSNDQIDLNYSNPDVLLAMIDILLDYLRYGARAVRLDAVGFLWKTLGTSCMHLPQTHQVVKLFRDVFDYLQPDAILLTETNVPHAENISYFGDGDEAHMVYQFALPPLVLHAIHTGDTRYLTEWSCGLEQEPLPVGCSYLNFTASHDGVGLRPLEGIIPTDEIGQMLDAMRSLGGFVSTRATAEGIDKPYELNISYYEAFRDPDEPDAAMWRARFLLSQTLPLALRGMPAVYFNALVAAENDYLRVESTGMTRSINRRKWDGAELEALIDDPMSEAGQIFPEYCHRLRRRWLRRAFHPEASQRTLRLAPGQFGVERVSRDGLERVLAVHNCTGRSQRIAGDIFVGRSWHDVLNAPGVVYSDTSDVELLPYQAAWFVCTEES